MPDSVQVVEGVGDGIRTRGVVPDQDCLLNAEPAQYRVDLRAVVCHRYADGVAVRCAFAGQPMAPR